MASLFVRKTCEVTSMTENLSDMRLGSESDTDDNEPQASANAASSKKRRNKRKRKGKKPQQEEGRKVDRDSSQGPDLASNVSVEPKRRRTYGSTPPPRSTSQPYVYVPVSPHYEFREVPASSSDDPEAELQPKGLFATQDVPPGTRIICEPAILALPEPIDGVSSIPGQSSTPSSGTEDEASSDGSKEANLQAQSLELYTAYNKLSLLEQDQLFELSPSPADCSPLLQRLALAVIERSRPYMEAHQKPKEERTPEDRFVLENHGYMLKASTTISRLMNRWHRHRVIFSGNPTSPGQVLAGLFIDNAKMRHSCVPNCWRHYDSQKNRMIVHTTDHVAKGTELTFSYIPNVWYLTAEQRAEALLKAYGYKCVCEACEKTHPNYEMHEKNREGAGKRSMAVVEFIARLDIVLSTELTEGLDFNEMPDVPSLEDMCKHANICNLLIKNLKQTGCKDPELIRWNMLLVERLHSAVIRRMEKKNECQRLKMVAEDKVDQCEMAGLLCYGADALEVYELEMKKEQFTAEPM